MLQRRKQMIDVLIKFVKTHPVSTEQALVKGLDGGKNGLSILDCPLIVPYWNGGDIQLRLLKSGYGWLDYSEIEGKQLVYEDVLKMPDKKLDRLLEKIVDEANGDS